MGEYLESRQLFVEPNYPTILGGQWEKTHEQVILAIFVGLASMDGGIHGTGSVPGLYQVIQSRAFERVTFLARYSI